ncbi:MAG: isoaspartyl peptidase/L-asparaginase, partial [Flammeovirgaceae bacterium]|nr:isoaspartyl peptidase/L-asparaginase [Flammeovirgaceae bacterium]
AGRGAVFGSDGTQEMEASIMCGKTLNAGAASGVKNVKNPILLARKILESGEFVYLTGKGANDYARQHQLEFREDEYFFTQHRWEQYLAAKAKGQKVLDHDGDKLRDRKFGTVGAVALDMHGNLAAATSTGGLTNKRFGRLGDSSMIGAGTYANNLSCGVSCTGYGEYFIRSVVAHDIACLMEYKGLTIQEACHEVVMKKLVKIGGEGGVIAVDKDGNYSFTFNSEGMYRGVISSDDEQYRVAIYEIGS